MAPRKSTKSPDLVTAARQRLADIPEGTTCCYLMHVGGIVRIGGVAVSTPGKKRRMRCPKWAVHTIKGKHYCDQHA